jgi:hypothetical protein
VFAMAVSSTCRSRTLPGWPGASHLRWAASPGTPNSPGGLMATGPFFVLEWRRGKAQAMARSGAVKPDCIRRSDAL